MASPSVCISCGGTSEVPTDYGLVDCPDCGGTGYLPARSALTDWRARDLGRALERNQTPSAQDVRWLLDELHSARTALNEVIALAHDIRDEEQIALRIRMVAGRALGLYETAPVASSK